MNPKVIEAAAKAIGKEKFGPSGIGPVSGRDYGKEPPLEREVKLANAAINAAMVALEPEIRQAVERLEHIVADHFCAICDEVVEEVTDSAVGEAKIADARRDLFALLGIPEQAQ